jgi:MFS family permease
MWELFSASGVKSVFSAQLISVAGDKMFAIAIAWWVISKDDLPDREWMLGVLLAATTLPVALSGPFLGPLIDKYDKRLCMLAADFGRFSLMAGLALLIHFDGLSLQRLIGLCIALFALAPLFDASVSAYLPALANNPAMLARLVALESAIPQTGMALGALFGSFALAAWNVEGAFWFNAGTFLASFLLIARLPPTSVAEGPHDTEAGVGGYAFLRRFPSATRMLVLFGAMNFFLVPVFLYLPLIVRDVLKADGVQLGLLELALTAGNLIVFAYFLASPKAVSNIHRLLFLLGVLSAACMCALGSAQLPGILVAILLPLGASGALVTYLAMASFQKSIPDNCKGRFFALLDSICTAGYPLSYVCFGFLVSRFPLPDIIYGDAACVFLVSFAMLTVSGER